MQKTKYSILYNYNKILKWWSKRLLRRRQKESVIMLEKNKFNTPVDDDIYFFDHQITLDHVCSEHERELIAPHGWDCILKYWNFHICCHITF